MERQEEEQAPLRGTRSRAQSPATSKLCVLAMSGWEGMSVSDGGVTPASGPELPALCCGLS